MPHETSSGHHLLVRVFNSSMFNNIIDYYNMSYKQKINDITIMGSTFNKVKIGRLI